MPRLTCPICGNEGNLKQSYGFERRGKWPDGHYPVVKCNDCGCGLVVKPTFLIFGARAGVIPGDVWDKMERMWNRELSRLGRLRDRPCVCDDCGKRFVASSALENHRRDAHGNA